MRFWKHKVKLADSKLLQVLIFIPLIYLSEYPIRTRLLRFLLIIAIAILSITLPKTSNKLVKNFNDLSSYEKVFTATIILFILACSALSFTDVSSSIIGYSPDYLGMIAWLLFIVLGITFADSLEEVLLSKVTFAVLFITILASLFSDRYYIYTGVRVSGTMLQATTMGMFAVVVLVLGLHQMRISKGHTQRSDLAYSIACLIILLAVLLSQSRVAIIVTALVLLFYAYTGMKHKTRLTVFSACLLITIISVPILLPKNFSRLHQESVSNGITYRNNLYITSGKDLLTSAPILGNGPDAYPDAINDRTEVPEDIAKSLNLGVKFASTHNLFLDFAYKFGLFSFISLLALNLSFAYKYLKNSRSTKPHSPEVALILIVLVFDAMFNIPSLELTLLYFLVLYSALLSYRLKPALKLRDYNENKLQASDKKYTS